MDNSERRKSPPVADKFPEILRKHKHKRVDNYYWLRERNSPRVYRHLQLENAYTLSELAHTEGLQEQIFQECSARIKAEEESVPYFLNGYFYYFRYKSGCEHPLFCRKEENLFGKEEILLDVEELARGHSYFQLESVKVTEDNQKIAYSFDNKGDNNFSIVCKNLLSGEIYPEKINNTDGDPEWAADSQTLFYIKKSKDDMRECELWKHKTGQPTTKDTLIYREKDETYYLALSKSSSRREIILSAIHTLATEQRFILADTPESSFQLISPRRRGHDYTVDFDHLGTMYVLTNKDEAFNYKIMKAEAEKLSEKYWIEIVGNQEDTIIEDFDLFENYLCLSLRSDAFPYLKIIDRKSGKSYKLKGEEAVYDLWTSHNKTYHTDFLRYIYSSPTTPDTYFDYDMQTGKKTRLREDFAGKNFDSQQYDTRRIFAKSADGESIPISLFFPKKMKQNGENPLLIYAYGAYGSNAETSFNPDLISLIDRGFVYAVAHVRGGGEKGQKWYENGKLLHKKNSISDFVSCTEYLHEKKWSKPAKTIILSESAGSLLAGAALNTHSHLYKAAVCEVPFVDLLTTMSDKTIPLTTAEYDEWGNPDRAEHYHYMLSYSPYDQIKAQEYPAMLITAAQFDTQVPYWEAAKWAAKMRAHNTGTNPVFLFTEPYSGHAGASGRFEALRELAFLYAFIIDQIQGKKEN